MTNKEAIIVLKNHISPYDNCKADNEANQAIRLAIKALAKRPQGEWILQYRMLDGEFYTCSQCKRMILVEPNESLSDYPFCHCGADMRKGGAE